MQLVEVADCSRIDSTVLLCVDRFQLVMIYEALQEHEFFSGLSVSGMNACEVMIEALKKVVL